MEEFGCVSQIPIIDGRMINFLRRATASFVLTKKEELPRPMAHRVGSPTYICPQHLAKVSSPQKKIWLSYRPILLHNHTHAHGQLQGLEIAARLHADAVPFDSPPIQASSSISTEPAPGCLGSNSANYQQQNRETRRA